jgi:hypothetical protein
MHQWGKYSGQRVSPWWLSLLRTEPRALAHVHDVLLDQLSYAVSLDSRTGEIARELDGVLKEHLRREDDTMNPVMSALVDMAGGHWPSDADRLGQRFQAAEGAYTRLLGDHAKIAALIGRLNEAAREDGEEEVVRLCDDLLVHLQLEEEVLYPAAVIAGRYLRLWERERESPRFAGD